MKRRLVLVKSPERESGGRKHTKEPRAMKTLEDSAAENSFALRYLDGLAVAQGTLAHEYQRLVWFHATDDLGVGAVVKPGLHAGLLRLGARHGENKCACSLHDQGLDRYQQRVFL